MIIYDNKGIVLLDIDVDDTSYRYKVIKGENSLTLKFSLAEHVEVPVGSYCYFKGEMYVLMLPEDLTMNHRRSFEYTLVMNSEDAKAKSYKFRNPVDGRLKFPLTAKPKEHLQMFVDNMNMRDSGWKAGECPDHVEIALSYNHTSCHDALVQLADALELDYWFDGKTVSIGKLELNKDKPLPLSYGGDGEGLKPNIKRTNFSNGLPIEVLYVQGSSVNIDPSKYRVPDGSSMGASELLLPSSQTIGYDGAHFEDEEGFDSSIARYYKTDAKGYYLSRADKEIVNHSEDSLDCTEIEPTKEEKVEGVWHVDREKHFFDIAFNSPVDYSKYQIGGETPSIVFQKGMLAGKEFDIATDDSGKILFREEQGMWRMEIVPQEIDGITMPDEDSGYVPVEGDTFKFFGIQLPEEYIADNKTKSGAEWDMFRYAVKHLYSNEDVRYTISGELDEIYAKRNWAAISDRFSLGNFISFSDKSFQAEPLLIRITGIKEYVNKPYSPILEISNAPIAGTLIGAINRIENEEVRVDVLYDKSRQYTKRSFANVKETIAMLADAIEGFSPGINPITLQTMAILVGSQTLQFTFIKSLEDTTKHIPAFHFDQVTGVFSVPRSFLMHYTIGVTEVTTAVNHDNLRKWEIDEFESDPLTDGSKAYYLYAAVPYEGTGSFLLSPTALAFEAKGGYNLLVGVLNTEYEGVRSFVPLYGYTEVLPGQITTDVIRSADGNTYFDLVNGIISGKIDFKAGSTGLENVVGDMNIGNQNMLRNSGFTGDYLSEQLADETVMDAATKLYNGPLEHWDGSVNVTVVEDEASASGYAAIINGVLTQQLYQKTVAEESYVLSFKAKGVGTFSITVGGTQQTIECDSEDYEKKVLHIVARGSSAGFAMSTSDAITICDLQLERGTVATAWGNSTFDNSSDRTYYQALKYLSQALAGSTTIAGGLVLTNLIQLGNHSNDSEFVEKAGASGLYVDDNSPAFWAGGTMEQAIETIMKYEDDPAYQPTDEELSSIAKFVVTHGGRAILNDIILRGAIYSKAGKLGNLNITEEGIEVNTEQGGKVVINPSGIILYGLDGNISGTIGYCGGSAISAVGRGGIGSCPRDDEKVGVYASSAKSAFFCNKGRFVGLRTATRVISEQGSSSERNKITELDTNILVNMTSGTCYINVLNSISNNGIEDGQEYIIETIGASLNITSGSNNIYSMYSGRYFGSADNPLTHTTRDVLRLKYYADADIWTCSIISKTA